MLYLGDFGDPEMLIKVVRNVCSSDARPHEPFLPVVWVEQLVKHRVRAQAPAPPDAHSRDSTERNQEIIQKMADQF